MKPPVNAPGESQREHFRVKRAQLEQWLDTPLLLYAGKWDGPNIRALTLAGDFTRPTFVLCEPGGLTTAFVQTIEVDNLAALADDLTLLSYTTTDQLKKVLGDKLRPLGKVAVEISDSIFALDRLPPYYLKFVTYYANLKSADDILVPFRAVKTAAELSIMKRAAAATLTVLEKIPALAVPGAAEEDILRYITQKTAELDGEPAFHPIVAAGPRSANPHPRRGSDYVLQKGDRLIVDCGVSFLGYRSDITRTFIVGGDAEEDPYYAISRELQDMVAQTDLSAMTPLALGQRAAQMVKDAGLSEFEKHGYGHGLGVETHDPYPYITATPAPWADRPFKDGMVFTFEPGFYDARGGFRIENDYVVWKGRAVRLENLPLGKEED